MSVEAMLEDMLSSASLDALFGDRRALNRLPQDTDQTLTCLVYDVITDTPTPNVNFRDGQARARARCRIKVIAPDLDNVMQGHAAVRAVLDFAIGGTYGGHRLLIARKVQGGPVMRDDSLGVWWRPDDYELAYYE
jgi:hypothetical protein